MAGGINGTHWDFLNPSGMNKEKEIMAEQAKVDEVRIDVDALATELQSMMMSHNLTMSPRCCIFRAPNILLRHNPKAFEPDAFSIGPFHYDKSHLKATQKIKLTYLRGLVSRFPDSNPELKLRDLTAAISEVEEEARECYAGGFDMSAAELVKILVLDGCFLIELFRKDKYCNLREKDDPIFSMGCMHEFLNHDLILLENQIPWLVLERLFNMTKTSGDKWPLTKLAAEYFDGLFSTSVTLFDLHSVEHENKHVLDLLRNSVVLSSTIVNVDKMEAIPERMPSATSLREAGIKFEKATSRASILDVTFENGVVQIPPLLIQELTESLFRNLICLEQCLPNCDDVITSYAILLDNLISTAKDMEVLCKSEVIDNWLDAEEATEFFNQLYNDTWVSNFYYHKLTVDVNKYCERHWPRYRRVLMHDYFRHPWALISVIVAAILLILTFLQTWFTIS